MNNAEFFRYMLAARPGSGGFTQASAFGPDQSAFQPQNTGQPVPMPRARPAVSQAQPVPMPMARPQQPQSQPAPQARMFSGEKGPQWTDEQWQNYWARSNPEGLMGYYPVEA